MCLKQPLVDENLPDDYLMPGHPYWERVRPSCDVRATIKIAPALRSGDPNDPVAEIVYLLPYVDRSCHNWSTPRDQPSLRRFIRPVVRFLKERELVESMIDVWSALQPLYDWLTNGSMYPSFQGISLPKGVRAHIRLELGPATWDGPIEGQSGRWQLYNEDSEKIVSGSDPVDLMTDPANEFNWKARAWLQPLKAARDGLEAFLSGECGLSTVLYQVHAAMVLS